MHQVYLSLGSNMGNRLENLAYGVRKLSAFGLVIRVSPVAESEAWGYTDTLKYLNIAVYMESLLHPSNFLEELQKIERSSGRVKTKPIYEARTLDIDILMYGDFIINEGQLEIPHPRMQFRNFVLLPLSCIAPDAVHPALGLTMRQLFDRSTDETPTALINDSLPVHSS